MKQRAVGWAKAVRPCPRRFDDSRPETRYDSLPLRVGTLRFAHPAARWSSDYGGCAEGVFARRIYPLSDART